MLSKSEFNDIKFISNVNSDTVDLMTIYFDKAHSKHVEKYGEIKNENDEIVIINTEFYEDSQSKYNKEKLINSIDNIVSIVNQNDRNPMYGIGTIYNEDNTSLEIDYKSIVSDSNDAIDKLCDKINSLDDSYNNELSKIFNNIEKLYSINNKEYILNDEPSINSELVHKLRNAIVKKLGINTLIDENILSSNNVLSVPELEHLENTNIVDIINDDSISSENKKFIFKALENEIKNTNGNTLNTNLYDTVNSIKSIIEDKAKQINELSTHEGQEIFVSNFVGLSSCYNDLIATAICNDKIFSEDTYNDIPISSIEFDNELDNRINYIMNSKVHDAINFIAKENPDKYKISNIDVGGTTYNMGGNTIEEMSYEHLSKGIIDKTSTDINNKGEAMSFYISDANSESSYSLKSYYNMKHDYINYQSPASINLEDSIDVETNMNKLNSKSIQRNIQPIDTYHSTHFFNGLSEASTYNKNIKSELITDKDGVIDTVTMYQGASNYEEMFDNMSTYDNNLQKNNEISSDIKNHMNKASKEFATDIQGTSYKLAKMAGRESQTTFDTFVGEFNSVSNSVSNYLDNNSKLLNTKNRLAHMNYHEDTFILAHNSNSNIHNINKVHKETRLSVGKSINKSNKNTGIIKNSKQ